MALLKNKKERVKKKNTQELVLILDIRSSSIGASVVQMVKNGPPLILSVERNHFFFEKEVASSEFIERAEVSLNSVLEKIINKNIYKRPIKSVEVFYGAPWYKTFIKNINLAEKGETTLTKSLLEKTVKEALEKEKTKNIILEKDLGAVLLNGYQTKNPFDKKVSSVDISLFLSILHRNTQKRFRNIIEKYVHTDNIIEHSHPLSLYNLLKEKFYSTGSYVLFDISGEVTEISIIRDQKFNKLISIPYGSHYFARGLAQKCNYNFETAFSKLKMICSKEIDVACAKKSEKAFEEMKKKWFEIVKETLKEFQVDSLPYTFYVSTDQEMEELIQNILENSEDFAETFKIRREPVHHFLSSKSIADLCSYKEESMKRDAQISLWACLVDLNKDKNQ